ncbi:MAG: hypothetical protein J6D16_02985 [Clostridia bacterium]|nr:hypothetical protein [Clostridia bacterium]
MKLWKLFVLALSLCLLCTCLFACGEPVESGEETPDIAETTPEETTLPETTPEETTTEFVCEHPNLVVNNSVPTCDAWGKIEKICEDCGFMEHTDLAPKHNDTEVFLKDMGATEATCADCGDKSLLVESGRTLALSAFFGGEFTVSLKAVAADEKCALVIDGKTVGEATFDENGEATLTATDIARGGHAIEIVNSGAYDIRAKVGEVDGYYSRPGALFIEVLPKGGQPYSSFRVYVQTSDPSEEYYVCYNFNHKYSTDVSNFKGNSCTNTSNYRIDTATLCRVEMDFDEMKRTDILPVLGGGEVSFAIMGYAHTNHIVEAAKEYVATDGGAQDFIGGFHGDEWIETVKLLVDGVEVNLKSNEKTVYPCSTVTFEQLTTMYAWATATSATDHGLPVAKHFQNIVLDSTGVAHKQTVEWLRSDFRVKSGYMPMFTMMRGGFGNRYIDTMRMYDVNGYLLGEHKMDPEIKIEKQTGVLGNASAAAVEYSGDAGVSARVDFRLLNDQAKFGNTYVALRVGSNPDNKLYVPITSSNYGVPLEGELWDVDTHYMIDYVAP